MNGPIDIFTILLVVVALVIILRLRSVLGRKNSADDARVERLKAEQRARAAAAQSNDKVVALPRQERADGATDAPHPSEAVAGVEAKVRTMSSGNPSLTEGMLAIARADRSFDPEHFITGAKQAYEMIVTAFAEGNRKTLKTLLSKDVFDGFSSAITEREGRGEIIDQSFVGISKAEIAEAELKGGQAQVTMRFVSELISATRDRSGTVISGDPKRIKDVTDIWTFARDVSSRDPNWKLIATQAPA
ncbi:MAG: Tim44/TimA family putative adaptor protein [Hyphomicrobiaceae bacterium]